MYKALKVNNFAPFMAIWGAVCQPTPIEIENETIYIVPLGWESELTEREIAFEEIELPTEEENEN